MKLESERLILRRWLQNDLQPFTRMNTDPHVMRFFPGLLSPEESSALFQRLDAHFETHGFGVWALELKSTGDWIGFAGLGVCPFDAHFTPAVELGWRLLSEFQGKGYATEAAKVACTFAFKNVGLEELVAFTVPINQPSRRVMEKLGMTNNERESFQHPLLPADHPLKEHVLYRLPRQSWKF
ncbi:MAG: GNAT family N-acetyltransferase [Spirochaetia bacterium]|nr:GNAT family N-acetyltransferase [Spirochaetia bacterium]